MLKRIPLYIQILLGLLLGVAYGAFVSFFTEGDKELWNSFNELTLNWIKPFGDIFVNCLKLIAVPLVLFSLVSGISSLKDITKLGSIGGRAISMYLGTTVIAVSIGLATVNILKPWEGISKEAAERVITNFSNEAVQKIKVAEKVDKSGPLEFLVKMVPNNIVEASRENKNMLQVIVFAILFGIALISIDPQKSIPVKNFFEGANAVILKIVDYIMYLAPLGTFALSRVHVTREPILNCTAVSSMTWPCCTGAAGNGTLKVEPGVAPGGTSTANTSPVGPATESRAGGCNRP